MIKLNIARSLFNDAYFPYLFDYSNRYEVYYGRAGSGKSVFITQKILCKACTSKRKVLVIRKYATTLKDSVFQLFIDQLKKWKIYKFCKVNMSTYTITLPNESVLLFKGLDDPEKIKSITDITDIWCEECSELSLDEFTQLDLRLRAQSGNLQIFVSFNPVSKQNFVYQKWFANGAPDNTFILHTTYKDNKFLPKEYIDALLEKQKSNPTYYKIYALGEFCTLDKLVYYNWRVEDFDHTQIKGKLLVGLDFGYTNDPTALVASVMTTDKKIYIFKEWVDTNKTNPQIAQVIKSLGLQKSTIICDSAEPKSIQELRQNGIYAARESTKGPDSIIHGIQRLWEYEIIVHPSCTETITEFENYAWQKDKTTGEYINKPIDMFNHCMDALRYSLQCAGQQIKFAKMFPGL